MNDNDIKNICEKWREIEKYDIITNIQKLYSDAIILKITSNEFNFFLKSKFGDHKKISQSVRNANVFKDLKLSEIPLLSKNKTFIENLNGNYFALFTEIAGNNLNLKNLDEKMVMQIKYMVKSIQSVKLNSGLPPFFSPSSMLDNVC